MPDYIYGAIQNFKIGSSSQKEVIKTLTLQGLSLDQHTVDSPMTPFIKDASLHGTLQAKGKCSWKRLESREASSITAGRFGRQLRSERSQGVPFEEGSDLTRTPSTEIFKSQGYAFLTMQLFRGHLHLSLQTGSSLLLLIFYRTTIPQSGLNSSCKAAKEKWATAVLPASLFIFLYLLYF